MRIFGNHNERGRGQRPVTIRAVRHLRTAVAVPTLAMLVAGSVLTLSAGGTTMATTSYVSPKGASSGSDTSCATAKFSSINAAIAAASAGSTVVVCAGAYATSVALDKSIVLKGESATVNASGTDNGIAITASSATVEGFTVENAIGEGILATGAAGKSLTNVTISDNTVKDNDQGRVLGQAKNWGGYKPCEGATGDCGLGLHLMSVASSLVSDNTVDDNFGGILVTDEVGPSDHDTVTKNTIDDNSGACAITLASHSTKAVSSAGVPAPSAAGVFDNTITDNVADDNGLKGAGGGVIIASPVPGGGVYGNMISGNTLDGNGMAGVALHAHTPGEDLNGNVVTDNSIGENNVKGDPDYPDTKTTGIVIASSGSAVSISISDNKISDDTYGIWQTAKTTVSGTSSNKYSSVKTDDFTS